MMQSLELHQPPVDANALHYAFPVLVFFYFMVCRAITVCSLQTQSIHTVDWRVHRRAILVLILAAAGTYITEGITTIIKYVEVAEFNPGQGRMFYLIASGLVFSVEVLTLADTKFPVWYPYYGTWFIAISVELVLLIVRNQSHPPTSAYDFTCVVIQGLRLSMFIILCFLYFGLRSNEEYTNIDPERQALLRKSLGSNASSTETITNDNRYGTSTDATADAATDTATQNSDTDDDSDTGSEDGWLAQERSAEELMLKRLKQDGNWFTYMKGFSIFLPYAWPMHNKALQFRALLVATCLLVSNALNVLVPRQMGVMIDNLSDYVKGDHTSNIWLPVIVYALLLFISGGAGIGWIRKWLWLPLEQYSYEAFSTASQAHIMSLSSDFHDSKTTSDLMQATTGGRSVTQLLETICFQVVPMFVDLTIAFAYLWFLFGPFMGLVLATTFFSYLYITTKLVAMRSGRRRQFITVYRKEWTVGHQSLEGWNTASLFNMIPYEQHRYEGAVNDHMKAKFNYEMSSLSMNAAQGLTMTCGLIGGLYIAVFQVAKEGKSIGQLTTFLAYWAQLQGPLVFFSSIFRNISYSLMDAERLLELFQMKPTITDHPQAVPIALGKAEIKFDHVSFAYDQRKPTLKSVSFTVPSGKTVAIVGETGGGKSTILKLIDRFYDVKSGSISIDGQDIRDVTLQSLRDKIGVVPQDPMLFNDSIINNIRYARLTATDEEIYHACKAAAVHDKIMAFPDGYGSKIGDRGVKLSGGEKQRIAIARTILKRPNIILLDEATSAVDTETEHLIQEGFKKLCENRTTIIVAHRLSTIMRSDRILVVMDGEIVEEGSHNELIRTRGKYHDLWSKQLLIEAEDDWPISQNPRKRDGHPIADLVSGEPDGQSDKANGKKPAEGRGPKIGHKREGSRLRPYAPEFVPLAGSTALSTNAITAPKIPNGLGKECNGAGILRKEAATVYGKLGKDRKLHTGDELSPTEYLTGQVTSAWNNGVERPKIKSTGFSRRYMAKTEPAIQDTDSKAISSGSGQTAPLAPLQLRRVSAPSDPLKRRHPSRPRARRSRHWRGATRASESLSGIGLGTTISEESTSH